MLDTPNTMEIAGRTIRLIEQHRLPAWQVAFDAGGGGKQIADRLHEQRHFVQVVGFGDPWSYRAMRFPVWSYSAATLASPIGSIR